MYKKFIVAILAGGLMMASYAQNARIDAMGGCDIIKDVTDILISPAFVNDHGDKLQGTVAGDSYGPIFGIKSAGRTLYLGGYADDVGGNGSSVLIGDFCEDASAWLEEYINDEIKANFPPVPHILVGVDVGNFEFGLDLFLERRAYSRDREDTLGNETHIKESMSNFGFKVGMNAYFGQFSLLPLIGLSFPKIKGFIEEESGNEKIEVTTESEKGLYLTIGAELGYNIGSFSLAGGFFFNNEKYQFKYDSSFKDEDTSYTNDAETDINSNILLNGYIGFTTEIAGNLLLAVMYDFGVYKTIVENQDEKEDKDKHSYPSHFFSFGMERPVDGFWIFDGLIPRAGIYYVTNDHIRRRVKHGSIDTDKIKYSGGADPVTLTTGLGIVKGIGTIDININFGDWSGTFSGPSSAQATLTIDFSKLRAGSSNRPAKSKLKSRRKKEQSIQQKPEKKEADELDFDF